MRRLISVKKCVPEILKDNIWMGAPDFGKLPVHTEDFMLHFIFKRILNMIPIIFGITIIVFFLFKLSPGDPAYIKLTGMGNPVTHELLEETREKMGLNKPVIQQYLDWLRNFAKGDWGESYRSGKPVMEELKSAVFYTFQMATTAFGITVVISVPLGILTALYANSFLDYVVRILSFLASSMPVFVLGLVLIYVFSLQMNLFPVAGSGNGIRSIILPSVSLSLGLIGRYTRQIRVAVLEEISQDYVSGARTRGLSERIVMIKHVLRNSMIAVVTMLGLSYGVLLGGTAIIESMFVWPGVGKLVVEAIRHRDLPIIQGFAVWMGLIYCTVNLMVDISYGILDPRVRVGSK